ncbi:carbohydrate ABC transporter permease [Dictyobacter kobayashii]|uniref:ABC transmembrane type-1 domain-containing protein n=1 Tax=Dictyobacter kobayashii TaxID=2014872 RepID=A0A402AZ18_9CHLR|nr:carbohydrate ABC transporter permease [Dictyobacter kobayashii]GCE24354.1 hypothetical protein KDK_81540 [Dictyobacter kobayashii]
MAAQQIQVEAPEKVENRPGNRRGKVAYWAAFALLVLLALIWLIPLAWAIDTALKPESETTAVPISWFASHFTLDAFITTLATSNLPRWTFNSALTSIAISLLTVVLASLAAFGISRVRFQGRNLVFWIILAGIMVPGQILIVPLFTQMQVFNMVDTYWGIILPQVASPVAVFIFKQYFDGIGLATVQTSFGIRYAQIMATAVIGSIPVLIVFLFFQKQIVEGIAGTGLKG